MESLHIRIPGFTYSDLHDPSKLAELSEFFRNDVRRTHPSLADRFERYRSDRGATLSKPEISALIVEMSAHVGEFISRMFGIEGAVGNYRNLSVRDQVIFQCKKDFFIRRALKKCPEQEALTYPLPLLDEFINALIALFPSDAGADMELAASRVVAELLKHEGALKGASPDAAVGELRKLRVKMLAQPALAVAIGQDDAGDVGLKRMLVFILGSFERWMAGNYYSKSPGMREWSLFKIPGKISYEKLVEYDVVPVGGIDHIEGDAEHYRNRDGFDLTDGRYGMRTAMSEVDYCILCHEREKDSCSKGFREGEAFRKNPVGYELQGCPLGQKISESHMAESRGDCIGALAIIVIDNPMCPGTGHRICNDCMKGCIYQKQDPVNIPQVETRVLTDVLNLTWGFEIYSLLTRWNPLNIGRQHSLPYNGKNVLVVGMGPAGYTMSHYLLNEGCGVVGIDGLKIEPLPVELTGDAATPIVPIRDYASLCSKLSERPLLGFGGVSEYGITVRWDKNFLTVLYLNLLRRPHFRVYDGVRFGGTLTVDDAWDLGFDHICFASGAGKPTFVTMENNLIRGIRKASDVLMALQLTGAGKKDSVANLQIQLPAIVIGGGLTAIDTATEVMAYYPVQVEKIRKRYDRLCALKGKNAVDAMFTKEEAGILAAYLRHAAEIAAERTRALAAGEKPGFINLIRGWGGVHLYYRKGLSDAPAYRLNHEEIIKGLEEGIYIVEKMNPLEAVPDEFGAVKELEFEEMSQDGGKWKSTGTKHRVPAKTVLVAAGTVPNIMYEKEYPGTFVLDDRGEFFQSHEVGNGMKELLKTENGRTGFFTSYHRDGKYITFYGDNHPVYEGNVVKAMASAKAGYPKVMAVLAGNHGRDNGVHGKGSVASWQEFTGTLDGMLRPTVVRVERLTPTIVEVVVHAPLAAKKFHPGQFFRLQNYEIDSLKVEETLLMMEGIALTGAWVDMNKGHLSMIILEMGVSSRLCSTLKPGQRVVVMGPTGTPTETPEHSTALLLGGGLGNAVLFSIAKAFREKESKVIYFAGYKKKEDFFKREEIEANTDIVVYSVDQGAPIESRRPQDKSFVGNIIQAMTAYAKGELGEVAIPLSAADRIIAIGSDRMMAAVTAARHTVLKPFLNERHVGIASINSPMQCMMKAICAQCLQRHIDRATGKEEFVFSCVNQDQCMDDVDFDHLSSRLKANTVMEKISNKWLDHLIEEHAISHV